MLSLQKNKKNKKINSFLSFHSSIFHILRIEGVDSLKQTYVAGVYGYVEGWGYM